MANSSIPGDSIQIAEAYMDSLLVESRVVGAEYPSTDIELFGKHFATPIMTAALGHLHNICNNPLTEMAKGAKMADAAACIGMGELDELQHILSSGAQIIKVIKPYADTDKIYEYIDFCNSANVLAIGMDVEHAVGVQDAHDSTVCGWQMKQPTLDELKHYAAYSKVPFIIKGVLSVADALKCRDIGCKGIILSHHNGLMRFAVPPIMVLPEIRKAIGNDMKIILDGSIRSGYDAFKALALKADAVSVGRPLIAPLKESQALGVQNTINAMTDELRAMMIRTDSKDISSIDPSVIWKQGSKIIY